jgi:hypothetical protein
MKIPKYKTGVLFICINTLVCFSQNLEKLGRKDALTFGGGINISSVLYAADGIPDRRPPFTYFLNGNITGNILGISIPFTFNYSNNQLRYSQPHNIQSLNPCYKWVKANLGITSMNFSPYTQANHVFTGGGVELTPSNFKICLLYGRFKKAVEFDFETNSGINTSFKRMGWGGYAGYEKNGHGIKVIYFGARDDPFSLPFLPENVSVAPMENSVVSVSGKTVLFKQVVIETEYALSGLTRNLNLSRDFNPATENRIPVIFHSNSSTQFFSAYKGSIGYRYRKFGIACHYERIDPDYQTLGAYYFNNDFENITIAPTITLLKGRLSLNANAGLQRNNLVDLKLSTTKRWVGSISASFSSGQKWTVSVSYSNFSSYTKQRNRDDLFYTTSADTLNYYHLSQNASGVASYKFGKTNYKQSLSLSCSYQVLFMEQGEFVQPRMSGAADKRSTPAAMNITAGHTVKLVRSKTTFNIALNANKSSQNNKETFYYGPTINLSRDLFRNALKLTGGASYNIAVNGKNKTNEVFNQRLGLSFSPKLKDRKSERLSFTCNSSFMLKPKTHYNGAVKEFICNVGANYSF